MYSGVSEIVHNRLLSDQQHHESTDIQPKTSYPPKLCAPGNHVNLVTHTNHGHPEGYLYDILENERGEDVDWEYIEQCGCGGHVLRVHVP
ncbi:hypothetical protein EL22_22330 [Halostagnicola sp. A56]|uniref:CGCGG family putative rSAM-modified RiPP protein n=1 Tax=Halostagnicola sp. A56 TaxID=1495067 RepID=UPI00065F6B2D|nr:hypothetical protein EL22_22330 [Halostagnicola sp. A56]